MTLNGNLWVSQGRSGSAPLVKSKAGNASDWLLGLLLLVILGVNLTAAAQTTNGEFQATLAAAQKGEARAQYQLARDYEKGNGFARDYALAARYLRLAADQGYADAQVTLGSYYGRGLGVGRDLPTAIAWYRKAADQGSALAEYALGGFYAQGRGVTNDVTEAIRWWKKAAGQGEVEAAAALGQLFLLPAAPYGTNYVNYPEALRWLRQAAAAGSEGAENNLGVAYENGFGVKRDYAAAYWRARAADLVDHCNKSCDPTS